MKELEVEFVQVEKGNIDPKSQELLASDKMTNSHSIAQVNFVYLERQTPNLPCEERQQLIEEVSVLSENSPELEKKAMYKKNPDDGNPPKTNQPASHRTNVHNFVIVMTFRSIHRAYIPDSCMLTYPTCPYPPSRTGMC